VPSPTLTRKVSALHVRKHIDSHGQQAGEPCLFYPGGGVSGFAAAMARVSHSEISLASGD